MDHRALSTEFNLANPTAVAKVACEGNASLSAKEARPTRCMCLCKQSSIDMGHHQQTFQQTCVYVMEAF